MMKLIPEAFHPFTNYIISALIFLKEILFQNELKKISSNISYSKTKESSSCCIVATGPSIKDIDLESQKNSDFFTVSNAFLHEKIEAINPKIHFFAPYHAPLIFEEYIDWLRKADSILPKQTKICLSTRSYDHVKDHNIFSCREIIFVNFQKSLITRNLHLNKPIMSPQSIPIMALQVALALKYKKISLAGCDHNSLKYFGESVEHFYTKSSELRSNSSDGDLWGRGLESHLKFNLNLIKQYKMLKNLANKNHVTIVNLSKNSFIDIFPKI